MIRGPRITVFLVLVLGPMHARSVAQSSAVANAKLDPALIHVFFDLSKKSKIYSVQPEKDATVQTVLKRFGPLPRNQDKGYRIWLVRPGTNGEADSVMRVDWDGFGPFGNPVTDYRLKPGDRLYVDDRSFLPQGACLVRMWSPPERIWQAFVSLFRKQ
jgi:hypothetical protein